MFRKHILIGLLLITTSLQVLAQAVNPDAIKALPAIICLLICEDSATAPPLINDITNPVELLVGPTITYIVFTSIGGTQFTQCLVSPVLPAGLSISISSDQRSCEISGTPTTETPLTSYTITASNSLGNDSATIQISVIPSFSVSGTITYDRIPTATGPVRLDYSSISQMPVRSATVQLLDDSDEKIDVTVSDDSGNYQFYLPQDQLVRLRVRAELLKTTSGAQYDVKVVDNTSADAIYTLVDSANTRLASGNPVRNLNAASGWGGSSYTSERQAAPFAVLDTVYEAMSDIIAIDPDVVFPPLQVNWSVNNTTIFGDPSTGAIGSSYYADSNIFVLGTENNDTDEFDQHIIVHEWSHYFENTLSRSDSIRGPHTSNDRLDMRVAFSEGFGNALSGMITGDPLYIDTVGANQANGFAINLDDNNPANPGWYSEGSVQSILYDLYDTNDDGVDTISLGLQPLYNVFTGEYRTSNYFTSIFTFITALKANNTSNTSSINAVVANQSIVSSSINNTGSTETNNAGQINHVLPVYTLLTLDNSATNICTNTPFNGASDANKLSNTRFLTFTITSAGDYELTVINTSSTYGATDPDFSVIGGGTPPILEIAESVDVNSEALSLTLNPGVYSMSLTDFNILIGSRGTACFDVQLLTAVN